MLATLTGQLVPSEAFLQVPRVLLVSWVLLLSQVLWAPQVSQLSLMPLVEGEAPR